MNKARLLIIAAVCIVACAGCANHNCSLIRFATEQAANTDQLLKKAAVEQINDSLKSIVITTISWGNNTLSFLSEKVEIEERRIVFYGFIGQMDAEKPGIDWALPMGADCPITAYLSIGTDYWVCMDGRCALFPKEVE